jgi:hypothetical protein
MALLCLIAASGCYDRQELVARALARVPDDHGVELDLGRYRVTLPRVDGQPGVTTLELEVAATVDRKSARKMEKQLEEVRTSMQHATLLALRQCNPNELVEPSLASLRQRIAEETEAFLTVAPIEAIALRSFAVYAD